MKHSEVAMTASTTQAIANGLGWFSVGLGLLEFFAPRQLATPLGLEGRSGLLKSYGLRELAAGLGILLSRRPAAWLWARAAGDALDMATVAPQLTSRDDTVQKANAFAALAIGAVAALDVYCALKLARQ
jgi:hypothetical protein